MQIIEDVEKQLHSKVSLLESLSIFKERKELYNKLTHCMKVHPIQRGQHVAEEGDAVDKIYWIINGTFSVTKIVPFVQVPLKGILYLAYSKLEIDRLPIKIYFTSI